MKNLLLFSCILTLFGCGGKSDPASAYGIAALFSTGDKADTTYNSNGDTIITVYKKVTNIKCDTTTITDSVKSLRLYVPPPVTAYVRKNLRMDYTSENSDALTKLGVNLPYNWNSLGKCCSYSIARSTDFARAGKYSTRYELRNTDVDVASSKRTEAARATNDEPTLAERWYGMSYFLKNWAKDAAPELVTQWQSKKGVSPPLAIWTKNDNWEIVILATLEKVIAPVKSNEWTDFVVHVKWSTGKDGLIEIWKGGLKIYTYSGTNTYAGYPGNYMKVGIYKWPWKKTDTYKSTTTQRILYADEVRIGNENATYNDVAPGN